MREVSDLFLRYQKYDNWQLYEGVVQTLFKGGPNAVDREFKTYEEVWFLKKKNCESHPKCSWNQLFIKIHHKIYIFTSASGHILLTIAFKCTGDSIHLAIIETLVNYEMVT